MPWSVLFKPCLKEKNKHSLRLNDLARGAPLCEYNFSNCIIKQDPDVISVIPTVRPNIDIGIILIAKNGLPSEILDIIG